MNTKYAIGAVIVIIILAAGGYLLFAKSAEAPAEAGDAMNGMDMSDAEMDAMASTSDDSGAASGAGVSVGATASVGGATVTYTAQGFSPSTITIKQGQSVTFVDETGNPMWIASDPHPLHDGYDGTTRDEHCAPGYAGPAPLDECELGESFTFTFDKVGTWGYHDHANDEMGGTVVVTQ